MILRKVIKINPILLRLGLTFYHNALEQCAIVQLVLMCHMDILIRFGFFQHHKIYDNFTWNDCDLITWKSTLNFFWFIAFWLQTIELMIGHKTNKSKQNDCIIISKILFVRLCSDSCQRSHHTYWIRFQQKINTSYRNLLPL